MKRYWTLLRTTPLLARLSLIQFIAYFGAWFSNVAIYTLLIHLHASPSIIALVAALHFFAGVLQAPLSGVIVDRIAPKKLMIVLTLIEMSATLSLISIDSMDKIIGLYLLIALRMGASSFQFTVEMSLLPKIVQGKALQYANEIHSIIWSLSYTAGMALGGFLVYTAGTTTAFLIDASLFGIAFILLLGLKVEVQAPKKKERFITMMGDAFGYIRDHPKVMHLMILHAVVGFTAFDALVVLSVERYYTSILAVSLGIGLINSARAMGLMIGPLFLGEWINLHRLSFLLLAEAISITLWGAVIDHFYLSLIASVLVGLVTTTLWSYTYTLLQTHTDYDYYGRVIAYNDMIFLGTAGVVSLLIGGLVDYHFSLGIIASLLGLAFALATLYYRWIRHHYTLKEIEN
jgi:MFS family permease